MRVNTSDAWDEVKYQGHGVRRVQVQCCLRPHRLLGTGSPGRPSRLVQCIAPELCTAGHSVPVKELTALTGGWGGGGGVGGGGHYL